MKINIIIKLLLINSYLFSQISNINQIEDNTHSDLEALKSIEEHVLLEEKLNPEEYVVGPGDEFIVNILASESITFPLIISPIGDVLIPSVGLVKLDGITLKEALNRINYSCKNHYRNAQVTSTIVNVKRFRVLITGMQETHFKNVSSISRVSDAIGSAERGGKISGNNYIWSNKPSKRNILLHRGEETINVDLVRFELLGDKNLNPYLMKGDIIELSYILHDFRIIGGVRRPGNYEWISGETIGEALLLAGGFTPNADSSKIEINTFINDTTEVKTILPITEKILKRKVRKEDLLIIRTKKEYHRRDEIVIRGEVKYPGIYTIIPGRTTVQDILSLAGGYTNKADLNKIEIRPSINYIDKELNRISSIPYNDRTDSEISYVRSRIQSEKGVLYINIKEHVQKALNYIVEPNTVIVIPRKIKTVDIIGGVLYPGSYPFLSGNSVFNYIELAGGYTSRYNGNTYIINSVTGTKMELKDVTAVYNEDIIFAEEGIEYRKWDRFLEIMNVLGQIAAIVIVVQNGVG